MKRIGDTWIFVNACLMLHSGGTESALNAGSTPALARIFNIGFRQSWGEVTLIIPQIPQVVLTFLVARKTYV
jgi:hypothetical protein